MLQVGGRFFFRSVLSFCIESRAQLGLQQPLMDQVARMLQVGMGLTWDFWDGALQAWLLLNAAASDGHVFAQPACLCPLPYCLTAHLFR
jgi:hypothetical protein